MGYNPSSFHTQNPMNPKLLKKISKLEQQLKQKGLKQRQRQQKIVELATMLQLANKNLKQNQRTTRQVQTQKQLRERIKELQLANETKDLNDKQIKTQLQRLKVANKELNQLKNKQLPWDQYYDLYRAKQKREAERQDASKKTNDNTVALRIIDIFQKQNNINFLKKQDRDEIKDYIKPMMNADKDENKIKKE